MRSADDYRKLAADCRREMESTRANDLKHALKRLADAYDRQADSMDGKSG